MDGLLRTLYFAGIAVQVVARAPHARARRRIPTADRRAARVERALLTWLSLTGLALPVILSATRRLDFANYRLSPGAKARVGGVGVLLLGAALWLFWRAHRDLGANWSPTLEVSAEQTLTTEGVYGVIRHPMYASQALNALAQALLLQNWIAGPGGLAAFIPMYLFRVPREERMMLDHFGDAYRSYCEATGRILPRLRRTASR